MARAIGLIEFKTTPSGIRAADRMVKTAEVELIEAQTVCPGKYIALVGGELAAVRAAVDAVRREDAEHFLDSFVLGNPHEDIFPALYGTTAVDRVEALGILETYDVASVIVAADAAAKTAVVNLIEIRVAKGMCGKSFFVLTGSVAAVEAAVEEAKKIIAEDGMYLDSSVIPHPDPQIVKAVL